MRTTRIERSPRLRRLIRRRIGAAAALLAAVSLTAACGGGSGGGSSGKASGPVHIKVWAWYPDFKDVVAKFNATHTDVQVDWTGQDVGQDEYTKLKTVLKAGKGAPDVVMLEFQELPTIEMTKGLLDMGKYGAGADAANYVDWAWKEASDGAKVYAIPVDAGPMAMLYRQDLFQQYNLKVPTTWAEYADDAAKLRAADPSKYITDFGTNEAAGGWIQGLMWQAGSKPYTYSASNLPNVGVHLNDAGAQQMASYWGDLIAKKQVDTTGYAATDFYSGLSSGKYLTYLAAGWGPGYLASVAQSTAGKWRAAPLPQWTAGGTQQGDWGGSAFSVTTQSSHPKQATEVARELFGTSQDQWKIGIDEAYLFPTVKPILNWDYFQNKQYPFFGNQTVNQVFAPAANGIGQFDWSPFQDYSYNQLVTAVGQVTAGKKSFPDALDELQSNVSSYASQQGFKVSP
jgi:multiple sugar transport system substrate-binding protein